MLFSSFPAQHFSENTLYNLASRATLRLVTKNPMRTSLTLVGVALALVLLSGCAGPERKLGRGINNVHELVRGGEIRRSMEQTALWDGSDMAYSAGFLRGFHRSLTRTAIGAYEIITAPFPPYGPLLTSTNRVYPDYSMKNKSHPWGGLILPEDPVYPEAYKPGVFADSIFSTDTSLGFSGGDVAPMIPGSRFRVFDN